MLEASFAIAAKSGSIRIKPITHALTIVTMTFAVIVGWLRCNFVCKAIQSFIFLLTIERYATTQYQARCLIDLNQILCFVMLANKSSRSNVKVTSHVNKDVTLIYVQNVQSAAMVIDTKFRLVYQRDTSKLVILMLNATNAEGLFCLMSVRKVIWHASCVIQISAGIAYQGLHEMSQTKNLIQRYRIS